MGNIAVYIGKRIRSYRNKLNFSQEELAERCGLHPTYIGQLERGEKNPTIETISKISAALNVSMSIMFEKLDDVKNENMTSYPLVAYQLVNNSDIKEQEQLVSILKSIIEYKKDTLK